MKYVFLALVLLLPRVAWSQFVTTPCLEKKNNRWRIVRGSKCTQMNKKTLDEVTKQLNLLDYYKTKYEPAFKEMEKKYKNIDASWKMSLKVWKEQQAKYVEIVGLHKQNAENWRKSFFKIKDMKSPPASWTKSPLLWFSVGVLATAAAVGLGYGLYAAVQPNK